VVLRGGASMIGSGCRVCLLGCGRCRIEFCRRAPGSVLRGYGAVLCGECRKIVGEGRPSTGNLCLPRWAQRPAGCRRGGRAAVSWPSGSRGRRPRGLLREHSADLLKSVGAGSLMRDASDQDMAGPPRRRNRQTRPELVTLAPEAYGVPIDNTPVLAWSEALSRLLEDPNAELPTQY
jgi:hypothetical protein